MPDEEERKTEEMLIKRLLEAVGLPDVISVIEERRRIGGYNHIRGWLVTLTFNL